MGADSWSIQRSQGRIRIRKHLWYNGPVHRAEISEALALSMPAVTNVINEMLENGIVQEQRSEHEEKRLGRKAALVDIQPGFKFFIGAEMRKDSRQVCLTDYRGNVLAEYDDTASYPDYQDNIRAVARLIQTLLAASPVPADSIHSIGLAVPGITDSRHSTLVAHRMYRWFNCAVAEDLAALTSWDRPIIVENDACARAYGIRMLQRGEFRQVKRFAYLFIARGLSCPMIPCSPSDVGEALGIGEIGYMIIQADDALRSGSITGHISDLAGERAIMDRCHQALREERAPILLQICGSVTRPSIPQVLEAQQAGDAAVKAILENAIRYLAVSLANICNFVELDLIFVDSRLFLLPENKQLLTDTVSQYLVAPHNHQPAFEFVEPDHFNASRCAALCAIRQELNQYEEE